MALWSIADPGREIDVERGGAFAMTRAGVGVVQIQEERGLTVLSESPLSFFLSPTEVLTYLVQLSSVILGSVAYSMYCSLVNRTSCCID